ncbi:MAG: CopD family protein, partial [Acetobacteraceae bacterium]|nr:CopD family protein [Acetobacteraceae bacterium]
MARGASDAALLSLLGALFARAWLAPGVLAIPGWDGASASRRLRLVVWASFIGAAAFSALWTALQTQDLAGSVRVLPEVLQETVFGHAVLLRAGLLVAVAGAAWVGWRWVATGCAALAVATLTAHTHAYAMQEGVSWLLGSDMVHLLAASAWLGGLIPLLLLVHAAPPGVAARASVRFSSLGTGCVLVLACTAFYQARILVGSIPALVGTTYGVVVLFKLCCFSGLLGF